MRGLMKVGASLLLLAFLLIGLSYSMLRAQGIGSGSSAQGRMLESETRAVTNAVDAIQLDGPIDLTVRQGPTAILTVRGEQHLLGKIETRQEGSTIYISTRGMLLTRRPLQAVLILPALTNLQVRGSGDSNVNGFSGEQITLRLDGSGSVNFNGRYKQVSATMYGSGDLAMDAGTSDKVEAELNGSGDLKLIGAAREMRAGLNGSGTVDAEQLKAETVVVNLHGSGDASVSASARIEAHLYGSGDVSVRGHPRERQVDTHGSGELKFND
jgi:hypothetical protein